MSIENLPLSSCLMQCQGENCKINHCCPSADNSSKDATIIKSNSKEKLPSNLELDLKSIKTLENDLTSSASSIRTVSSKSEGNGKNGRVDEDEDDSKRVETDEVSVADRTEAAVETSTGNK